ncbi:probable thiopurine S-methyltransferase isoform X1 [Hemiscyllium ocellatum]|uniref:probable thiopurine S-methyltransferase isoform X1 n=2 Tax=Hemiscyllium ocellatum TaxID=170820 RepID=UPI0029670396|nr:probable thiopurine S-methyltransferase isoform X1 [Hemiscyllium ocellatum]
MCWGTAQAMSTEADAVGKTINILERKKPSDLTLEHWIASWEKQQIGFHLNEVHEMLKRHLDVMLNGRKQIRIFFPLCGKAVDMKWLADQGNTIVGVEISEIAIKQFFTEQNLSYIQEPVPGIPDAEIYKTPEGHITLFRGNIFDFSSSVAGQFDGIWDRGSLQPLNTSDRQRYSKLMITLMAKGCRYLLDTYVCTKTDFDGLPPKISESETRDLFGHACNIHLLDSTDKLIGKQKLFGLEGFIEEVHLITLKSDSS